MTQEQEFEFRARAEAEQAAAVPRSSLADRAAMREAQARNARVMRIIPGTGFLSPEKGLRSNEQSQALLQGLSYNTSDEMASALAAARTGISNLGSAALALAPEKLTTLVCAKSANKWVSFKLNIQTNLCFLT